ncbi:hypothetical protein ACFPPD_18020 [Cohnella suwonensis]|uniref:50S ribosomal protein L33 n=1 Tax=Cohnella suwonensis TaxID=696072 RepID=A0ABW0LXI7_9BACL
MAQITRSQVNRLVGKEIKAMRKDGSVVTGKLVRVQGNRLVVEPAKSKKVRTKAIIPLVLFDLLAIGTLDGGWGWGGGYGYGYDGYGYGGGWW